MLSIQRIEDRKFFRKMFVDIDRSFKPKLVVSAERLKERKEVA